MTDDRLLLGIDVGTESARAVLFDPLGNSRGSGTATYVTRHPEAGWAEQDPVEVWNAVVAAVRQTLVACPGAIVEGCSLASTAVTLTAVASTGETLGPALLWMDTRAAIEADEINRTNHPALWYTGGAISPEWMLPKALWLKRHDPDRYDRAQYIVDLHDWLIYQLTGRWALSLSTISGEWCYVSSRGGWPYDLLDAVGLADLPMKWPDVILAAGEPVGCLTPRAAETTGLPPGLPIVQGLMDSYAAALACDVFAPNRLSLSLGSSSSYLALMQSPISDDRLLGPVPDAFGHGTWAMQGGQTSAASAVRWFQKAFAPDVPYTVLDEEATIVPPGCEGVRALDTLQGCRTPYRDSKSRGALWGFGLTHNRAHVYRALLEAVAYGGRLIVETLQDVGVSTDNILACGGGSQSSLWMQIHADVLRRPIAVLAETRAPSMGAAICAGVGVGLFNSLTSAASAMARPTKTYYPDPSTQLAYAAGYDGYLAGYQSHQQLRQSSDHYRY
jgi:sugar (pentulose or hexulose) kinase